MNSHFGLFKQSVEVTSAWIVERDNNSPDCADGGLKVKGVGGDMMIPFRRQLQQFFKNLTGVRVDCGLAIYFHSHRQTAYSSCIKLSAPF